MPIYDEIMTGGGVGGGSGIASFDYSNLMTGGGVGGGSATFAFNFNNLSSGGGVGGGTYITEYNYVGSGGVTVGGTAPFVATYVFSSPQTWETNGVFEFTKTFVWDDGESPMRWFRITGCCRYPTASGDGIGAGQPGGCEVIPIESQDGKCKGALGKNTFIQNIAAHNLGEVCRILKEQRWTWPICDISAFSRPADNRFVDPDDNCNQLQGIELPTFCSIPDCFDFCLHTDATVHMGMDSDAAVQIEEYVGSGGVTVGGTGGYRIIGSGTYGPDQQHVAQGGVIVGGAGHYHVIYANVGYPTDMGMSADVQDVEVNFSTVDTTAVELEAETGTVTTNCVGCRDLPFVLNLAHNLNTAAVFIDFCTRNGFFIPVTQLMYYSNRIDAWTSTLHYTGVGDANQQEYWRILFDWSCVSELGGQELGEYVWKFGISAVRKNLVTGETHDTRLLLSFPPEQLCVNSLTQSFDFKFFCNTQLLVAGSTDKRIVAETILLYDNIGMFHSAGWVERPNIIIEISQESVPTGFILQDISPIFPKPPVLGA